MSKRTLHDSTFLEFDAPPCGALTCSNDSVCWRVWAPDAHTATLVLHNPPDGESRPIPMQIERNGYFTHTEPLVAEGQPYSFRIDDGPERPDPASRRQPQGVHKPSAVVRLDQFEWSEGDWPGLRREQLVIYELHVGAFTAEGTFDAAINRLELLRELGITAVELMPIGQFPGERGWGYDGVHPYAVHESYGGPRGFQRFVDACHRTGLAVILDVIYNHLGPEGNYLAEFGPYFTGRYRTPWGAAFNYDDRGSDAVRAFVVDNARQWIRDFHVDGLRLDAVHAIFDGSPRHILRDIKDAADEEAARLGRPVHVIAESDLNDVRLLDRAELGGFGLSAQWSDDFHHAVHALLTGERHTYYADFGGVEQLVKALNQTFVYDGCYSAFRGRRHGAPVGAHPGSRFVISIQNHDQIGNRPDGERFGSLLTPARQRLAAGLLLLAPHIPLIFMGEEYGETHPFPFFCSFLDPQIAAAARHGRRQEFAAFEWHELVPDPQEVATFESARLTWSWPAETPQAGLRKLYYDLLTLRRFRLPLREFSEHTARTLERHDGKLDVVRLERRGHCDGTAVDLIAFFNVSDQTCEIPERELPPLQLLLSSESQSYFGNRTSDEPRHILLPYECQVYGPGSVKSS
ncbi:MAG TPA: malto-oligosyltrehalose trehalohydrolase [Planctomycetaceae bacterium]|jgi:maltooligosyltrehalose trehalohydrolase